MKPTIFIVFSILLSFSSFSQDDASEVQHEIGINATFFVKQFLSFSSSSSTIDSPYALTYKRISPDRKNALRLGFGLEMSTTDEPDDDVKTSSMLLNNRIGYEKRIPVSKKWLVCMAGDITTVYQKDQTETNFKLTDKIFTVGIGPVLGIEFQITDKIGLYTESSFSVNYSYMKEEFQSSDVESTSTSTGFNVPSSIFLTIKF